MTLKELELEVLALTFEGSIEDNTAFISAVRRALMRIATERDYKELICLYQESADTGEYYVRYDLKENDERFLAFAKIPADERGNPIPGARTLTSLALIPKSYKGYVVFEYKRSAEMVSYSDTERELDVPKECEHLVGLLVAAFLLLDGNEALADYYMNLYREGIAAVKVYNRERLGFDYLDTTGWA